MNVPVVSGHWFCLLIFSSDQYLLIDAAVYMLLYEEMEGGTIPILLYDERIRANWPQFLVPGYGKQNCSCDRSIRVKRFNGRPLKYVFTKQ